MNALQALLTRPLTVRVGWALVHFVWQGALLAALLGVFLWFARRSSAGLRYTACCGALLVMAACPPVTFVLISGPEPVAAAEPAAEPTRTVVVSRVPWSPPATGEPARVVPEPVPVAAAPARPWWERGRHAVERHLGRAVAVWLAGVLLLSVRLLFGWRRVRRLRRSARPGGCAAWEETVGRLARRLGVRRPVQVLESALAGAPAVVGWLKPALLLPASALTGLTPEQLEGVLAHELAHVRRHDYAVNLAQTVVETLLFYHPAVHWVSWRMRCEREVCCDETAVEVCGDSLTYARALAELEGLRCAPGGATVGLRGGSLLERIRRIAGPAPERGAFASRWAAGLLALALAACVAAGGALGLSSERDGPAEAAEPGPLYEKATPSRDLKVRVGGETFAVDKVLRCGRDGEYGMEDGRGNVPEGAWSLILRDYRDQASWLDPARVYISPRCERYHVIELRVFDHATREMLTFGDGIAVGYDMLGSVVRLRSVGGMLPDSVDIWLELVMRPEDGQVWRLDAEPGSQAALGSEVVVLRELREGAGSASMRAAAPGEPAEIEWHGFTDKGTRSTAVFDLRGPAAAEGRKYQVRAFVGGAPPVIPDYPLFLWRGAGATTVIVLDVPAARLEHFELWPFRGREQLYFDGVRLPRVGGEPLQPPPRATVDVGGREGVFESLLQDLLPVQVTTLKGCAVGGVSARASGVHVTPVEAPVADTESAATVVCEVEGLMAERLWVELLDSAGRSVSTGGWREEGTARTHCRTLTYTMVGAPLSEIARVRIGLSPEPEPNASDSSETGATSPAVVEGPSAASEGGTGAAEDGGRWKAMLPGGVVVERVVRGDPPPDAAAWPDWLLDLDTGKLYGAPAGIDPEREHAELHEWACEQGIDATAGPPDRLYLLGDCTAAVVPATTWDEVTPGQVLAALAEPDPELVVEYPSGPPAWVLGGRGRPASTLYAFKTREGGMGVLQIVGFSEDPKGVRIRYKMVQTAGGAMAEGDKSASGEAEAVESPATLPGGETNVHIVGLGGFETRFTFGGWELYWIPIGAEPTAPWLVLPYEGGEELEFVRRGPVVYASVDDGQQERIGVWVRDAEDLSAVSAAAGEAAEPLAVWLDAPLLGELADLPERAGIGLLHLRGDERPSDLSPLSAFANLTALYVGAAQDISDLGPLAALPRLSMLTLHPCEKVTDLGPLAELTEMRGLDLKGCRGVSDLGPLAGLTNLESLNLSGCTNVQDVSPLAHLGKLRFLAMSAGEARDISALGSLTELRSLSLGCGSVQDVSPLAHLGKLRFLSISGDGVRDVSALGSLTELRSLRLGRTRNLSDLSPLAGLDNLAALDLSAVRGDPDLSVLAGLAGIRSLSLPSTTSQEDLEALLPTLPGLTELGLHGCERIGDLSPLAAARGLAKLSLWGCDSISDLSPLAHLGKLRFLTISGAEVSDLSPLADLPELDHLDLRACAAVSDLSPLRDMVGRGGKVSVDERLEDQLESLRAEAAAGRRDESASGDPTAGLRLSLSAPEGTEYRSGRPLRLAAELRNVGPEPVPFSRLGWRAGLKATDDRGGLVVRTPVIVSPWQQRDGALAPGEVIRWDEWFDRLRFARPPEAGSTVRVRLRLAMRAEKADAPGGTPRLFEAFSDPVSVAVVGKHPARLGPDDVPGRWGSSFDFVYRESGTWSCSPGIHISGDGTTTLVGGRTGVLIPPGRTETVLERQELDALAAFLRDIRVWELADVKDDGISAVDQTDICISVACGGASLVRTFPWRMLAREPALSALVTEVYRLTADIVARERPDFMPGGEAVEGVQVGLRAGMRRWQARETPRLTATVRNLGSRSFTFAFPSHYRCQVEVDGTWYRKWPPQGTTLLRVRPWGGPEEERIDLTGDWHVLPDDEVDAEAYDGDRVSVADEAGRQVPQLALGTHVVRVACVGRLEGETSGPPIRVVSNPVEVEVVPDEQFTLGPVVERLVGDKPELRDCAIDLDAGVLHTLDEDLALDDGAVLAWCQANGVDAFGELGTGTRQGLSPVDTAFVPVEPETWDFSPDEVRGTVARAWPLPLARDPRARTSADKTPATFVFRTREGGMGVLQIVGFSEEPKGVRVRYKMVQAAGAATGEGESGPAVPGGSGG
jgi:beta-lactamase regulating signal transducer with metallopeptidase domain/Leucine-rich repeat (LRR) protein